MILMSVIVVTVDYDILFHYNNNIIYSSVNNRNINRKRNVSMKRIIKDKLDSRLDKKFIFFKFWKWHSDICINTLSNQANEYFKN